MIKYFPSYILPRSEGNTEWEKSSVKIQPHNSNFHMSVRATAARASTCNTSEEKVYGCSASRLPRARFTFSQEKMKFLLSIQAATYFHTRLVRLVLEPEPNRHCTLTSLPAALLPWPRAPLALSAAGFYYA